MGGATATLKTLSLAAGILLLAGCPHPEETVQKPVRDAQPPASLRRAEESFNPSEHDPVAPAHPGDTIARPPLLEEHPTNLPPTTTGELAPGFRVQIISTRSIDEANARKQYAESLYPAEWFYLQYDPPTYKIRAGNFLSRLDADRFRSQIATRGFPDAWVVPERVLKNPPPPPGHDTPPKSR